MRYRLFKSPIHGGESETEALNRASGFLRSQLSRDSSMRSVPQLKFYFDSSVGRGRELEDLIQRAAQADRKLAARAGDED